MVSYLRESSTNRDFSGLCVCMGQGRVVEIHWMCLEIDKQFKLLGVRRAEMYMYKTQDEIENTGGIFFKILFYF